VTLRPGHVTWSYGCERYVIRYGSYNLAPDQLAANARAGSPS
jgi:hypothetical protein